MNHSTQFVGVVGGQSGVVRLVRQLDHRRRSQSAVEVIVQENLGRSLNQIARKSNCHKDEVTQQACGLVGDTFQQQRFGVHLAFTYDHRVRDCVAPLLKMCLVVGVQFEHRLALGDRVAFTYQTHDAGRRAHGVLLASPSGAESPRRDADTRVRRSTARCRPRALTTSSRQAATGSVASGSPPCARIIRS